jgi:hypothetical protein
VNCVIRYMQCMHDTLSIYIYSVPHHFLFCLQFLIYCCSRLSSFKLFGGKEVLKAQVCLGMYRADLQEQWKLLNLIMQRPVRQLVPRGEYTVINLLDNYPRRSEDYMHGVNMQINELVHISKAQADDLQDKAGMSFSGMVSCNTEGGILYH